MHKVNAEVCKDKESCTSERNERPTPQSATPVAQPMSLELAGGNA